MLQIIFNNRKNQKWIFASFLLISIGFYFFGILDPNQVILSIPPDNTPDTRFNMAFGAFKINHKMSDSLKSIGYEDCCVDIMNADDFYDEEQFYYDYIYIVTFDSVVIHKPYSSYYPLLKVISRKKIDIFYVYFYLLTVFIVNVTILYIIVNPSKGKK